ncbi:Gfo/Idh/MocA family oxidoreductase [Chelativorans sp.]|uniref:Gfo/Idh/MocA family protein n=1 Tax=Chelativorans sp. TaxID=2203393 RepID=UPI0028120EE4|nr:Gfo/Idh/MocA family oxidoreductase [Chelativorans sp.]
MASQAPIRAAVIGAGWYAAQNHIPVLAARGDLVLDGVSRLGAEALLRVKEHFGFAFASEDYREVLARRPDVVIVASPHHLHYQHARDALEAGAHVLCEKPMTLDPREAWDLVKRAEAQGRHLLIANGYQYLPGVEDLRRRIAEGAVGRIEHVMCSFISATRDVFAGEGGLKSWETSFFRPDKSTWQDPEQGGGFAYGQMSHAIALLLYLTGLEAGSVSAHSFPNDRVDFCNAATVSFAGGAVGVLSGAAAMPQGNRALLRFFITGSEGLLVAEFDRDWCEIRRFDGAADGLELADGAWTYRCDGPVDALVDLAKGFGLNASPGTIGAATVDVISALLQSSREGGRPIAIAGPLAPENKPSSTGPQ